MFKFFKNLFKKKKESILDKLPSDIDVREGVKAHIHRIDDTTGTIIIEADKSLSPEELTQMIKDIIKNEE